MSNPQRHPRSPRQTIAEARPDLRIIGEPATADPTLALPRSSVAVPSSRSSSWARRYRSKLRKTDSLIIVGAILVSSLAQVTFGQPILGDPALHWFVALLMMLSWASILGAYHTRDPRVVGVGVAEYKAVLHATTLVFGLFAVSFALAGVTMPHENFILALPVGLVGLTLSRWLWRKWLAHQRASGSYLSRALVVGGKEDVEYVIGRIGEKDGGAYSIVGAVLDTHDRSPLRVGTQKVPVVCDLDHVADAANALGVDIVIVAGQPQGRGEFVRDLGWDLEGTSAELVLASRLTNVAGPRIHFRPVEGLPLMHVELPQYEGGKHVLKRAFDVVASGGALILLIPLMLVLAALVRLDSPGPAIFRQERVGRGGKTFGMLKFRSMVVSAEDQLAGLLDYNEGAGVLFKMKNDPRVTPFGKTMRKYSLDELPQLWNVLTGQMSLVGPRPPLAREVAGYEQHVNRRLYIKPGLTGLWQVNGRSNLGWAESVRLDLYYVENWSLTGDLVIMWRTLKVLRHHSGAY